MRNKINQNNKRLAKCCKKSYWHCLTYRHTDKDCIGCALYSTKGKNKSVMVNGVRMLKCIICGNLKPETEFYTLRTKYVNRFGDILRSHSFDYRCKECISRQHMEAKERKRKNDT